MPCVQNRNKRVGDYMGEIKVLAIPYKDFKHRIRLTKDYIQDFYIENMSGYLLLVRRDK